MKTFNEFLNEGSMLDNYEKSLKSYNIDLTKITKNYISKLNKKDFDELNSKLNYIGNKFDMDKLPDKFVSMMAAMYSYNTHYSKSPKDGLPKFPRD